MNSMNKKGLTLFELLVASGLFSLLAMVLLPAMQSFFIRLEISTALRALTSGLNTARYMAIQNNQPVRAEIVPGRLLLSLDDGQGWRVARSFALSEKMSVHANSRPVFSPLGNVSPLCTITVQRQNRVYRVVLSMYGRIKVYDNG
jgi:prepilin-type N-terminal cleavage/methylation domain-containing protein